MQGLGQWKRVGLGPQHTSEEGSGEIFNWGMKEMMPVEQGVAIQENALSHGNALQIGIISDDSSSGTSSASTESLVVDSKPWGPTEGIPINQTDFLCWPKPDYLRTKVTVGTTENGSTIEETYPCGINSSSLCTFI